MSVQLPQQVYIDDIIIVTASQETHVRAWEHLIKVLEYEGLALTKPKIEIGVKYLRYLGHIISHTEVFSDPKKVEAISELPKPRTKKDVRCFLGMINYYRPYILNFGEIASVLTTLTTDLFGRDISKEWDKDPKYDEAMQLLITKMCQYPILRMPDLSRPWVVVTDASAVAIGAALCQEYNGKLAVVEFASRALIPAERNYTATERECLGVKWAMERWRLYLLGGTGNRIRFNQRTDALAEVQRINERDAKPKERKRRSQQASRFTKEYTEEHGKEEVGVKAKTDHSALIPLQKKQQINNSRLAHWVTTMAEFDYQCEYVPGDSATLDVPDCLSRLINPNRTGDASTDKSDEFLYSNSWTSVYATLFDRLNDENSVNSLTVQGSTVSPGANEDLPSGAVTYDTETAEQGCDEHGETEYVVEWTEDVINHVETYAGGEAADEWTQLGVNHCDGERMCEALQDVYCHEFSKYGKISNNSWAWSKHTDSFSHEGDALSAQVRKLVAVDQMRSTPQINCARPIDTHALSADATVPIGEERWRNRQVQEEYRLHSESLARRDTLCTNCIEESDELWDVCTLAEGERRGNWYRTADKEKLADIAHKNYLTSHKLVLLNEEFNSKNEGGWLNDWPTANRELKRSTKNPEGDASLTMAGTERVYNRVMKADTWLRMTKDAKLKEVEAETVSGSTWTTQVPRTEFQPDEMSGQVKLLQKRDYYELSTDAQETLEKEARKRAANTKDEKSGVEQDDANEKAKRARDTVTANQRQARETRRVMPTTYAEMYTRAVNNSNNDSAELAVSNNPYFRLRGEAVEVRKDGLQADWLVVVPTKTAQDELVNRAHTIHRNHANTQPLQSNLTYISC
jgi:hypothetical protein